MRPLSDMSSKINSSTRKALPLECAGALHMADKTSTQHQLLKEIVEGVGDVLAQRCAGEVRATAIQSLAEHLQAWKSPTMARFKTEGQGFASFHDTIRAAEFLVAERREEDASRSRKRKSSGHGETVLSSITGKHWQRPVSFVQLGAAVAELWRHPPVTLVTSFCIAYIHLRIGLRLWRQHHPTENFDSEKLRVGGERVSSLLLTENWAKEYIVKKKKLTLPVTALNTCLLTNLHDISPLLDPVQVRVAENIGAMASGQNVREYLASVLRGTILVHATRRFEFSSILRGRSLRTEEDLMSFICNRADADMSLSRRATSEGRIPFGAESQAFIIAGRSNIADTFEGGQYFQEFTASLDVLASGFDEQGRPVSGVMDADLLDRIWGELRRIKGFGAMQNDGVADGPKSLGGFILKNIVFQGLRCFLHQCGFEWRESNILLAGPNPLKLLPLPAAACCCLLLVSAAACCCLQLPAAAAGCLPAAACCWCCCWWLLLLLLWCCCNQTASKARNKQPDTLFETHPKQQNTT